MRLHNKKHVVYMAYNEEFYKQLNAENIEVIPSKYLEQLRENERCHADMQLCIIKNKAFVSVDCEELKESLSVYGYDVVLCSSLSKDYPKNVALNVALIGNKLFCKGSSLDEKIREYCNGENIEIINVNQGYTKCSTLILNEKAIITADNTICSAAVKQGIEVLKISPGDILLDGAEYGFIGGCSGVINNTVYFLGDISKHRNAQEIVEYIEKQHMNFVCLSEDRLKDIGGFILLR